MMNAQLAGYTAKKFYISEHDSWSTEAEVKRSVISNVSALIPHEEIEQLLNNPERYKRELLVVHEGIGLDVSSFRSREELESFSRISQASLVFPELHHQNTWLSEVCRSIEEKANLGVFTATFYTPPEQQTLSVHWDASAGVALQLMGRKRWWLWRPVISELEEINSLRELTLEEQASHFFISVVLVPGDILFIPRGWPHCAVTDGKEASLHVTFGAIHRDIQHRFPR
jgi:ribosomal protein L16 Arg81 hydroxylase